MTATFSTQEKVNLPLDAIIAAEKQARADKAATATTTTTAAAPAAPEPKDIDMGMAPGEEEKKKSRRKRSKGAAAAGQQQTPQQTPKRNFSLTAPRASVKQTPMAAAAAVTTGRRRRRRGVTGMSPTAIKQRAASATSRLGAVNALRGLQTAAATASPQPLRPSAKKPQQQPRQLQPLRTQRRAARAGLIAPRPGAAGVKGALAASPARLFVAAVAAAGQPRRTRLSQRIATAAALTARRPGQPVPRVQQLPLRPLRQQALARARAAVAPQPIAKPKRRRSLRITVPNPAVAAAAGQRQRQKQAFQQQQPKNIVLPTRSQKKKKAATIRFVTGVAGRNAGVTLDQRFSGISRGVASGGRIATIV